MRRVVIMSPCVVPSAVGNDIIGMYNALKSLNINVKIFSEMYPLNSNNRDFINFCHINSYVTEKDVIIYHHATGWEKGLKILKKLQCRKIIKYHNVTPPQFFRGVNSVYEKACAIGRRQLRELADMECQLYISDSNYNMIELIMAGAPENKSIVIPPFHQIDRLLKIKPDSAVLNSYSDNNVNVLMIGRLSPNKGHIELIQSFSALQPLLPESRLLIVGGEDPGLMVYNNRIRNSIRSLGLSGRVVVSGEVTDSQLKSFYIVSQCLLVASQHEGFCVPLVEAMSMKVPIVAYGSSAIPETAGNAGVILNSNDPFLLAATVNSILKDQDLLIHLKEKGYNRYRTLFANDVIKRLLIKALTEHLQ